MRERPTVTALVIDLENVYRYIEIRGKVVDIDEKGADAHIDDLSEMYINERPFPWKQPGEVRVKYKIKPERVIIQDD